jgi:hypothetical protein
MVNIYKTKFCVDSKFADFLKFDKYKMGKTDDDFGSLYHIHFWFQPDSEALINRGNLQ